MAGKASVGETAGHVVAWIVMLGLGWFFLGGGCTALTEPTDTGNPVSTDTGSDPNEWNGYDIDCADVGGPVIITGSDPNGLDADGDGVGCE
jgi:hypothetical protein